VLKRKMSQILPNLYLGGLVDVGSPLRLKDRNIGSILSIFTESVSVSADLESNFTRLHLRATDDDEQNLIQFFPEAIAFIHKARKNGVNCLVHCIGGVSRSSTMVIAYVMTLTGWSWRQAFECVKGRHMRACPNGNFQRQLKEFEKKAANKKGSREDFQRSLLNGDRATEEDLEFLDVGRRAFADFVARGVVSAK